MKKLSLKLKVPVLNDILASFKLVQWPSIKEISISLLAVLVISAIIGGYLWGLDTVFNTIRNAILF